MARGGHSQRPRGPTPAASAQGCPHALNTSSTAHGAPPPFAIARAFALATAAGARLERRLSAPAESDYAGDTPKYPVEDRVDVLELLVQIKCPLDLHRREDAGDIGVQVQQGFEVALLGER